MIAAEGRSAETACRVLDVSCAGYYAWRVRPPSARQVRHAWLTDLIGTIHAASRGTYGAPRVRAELVLGMGITVGHNAVAMLMRRAGLKGLPARRAWRARPNLVTVTDLVDRQFAVSEPNALWVTDITEHPTREGKVYCCVVLDAYSRRVVGWSIDSTQTQALVTNALGMAVENRRPTPGTILHSDHGTQGEFNWSLQHLVVGGVDGQASGVDGGVDGKVADEVAWGAVASTGSRAAVLA